MRALPLIPAEAGMSGGRKLSPMIENPTVSDAGESYCPGVKAATVRTIAVGGGVGDWAAIDAEVRP